jgi:hypothetical protein
VAKIVPGGRPEIAADDESQSPDDLLNPKSLQPIPIAATKGCMDVVTPHLQNLVPYLITLLNDPEPLVRQNYLLDAWALLVLGCQFKRSKSSVAFRAYDKGYPQDNAGPE